MILAALQAEGKSYYKESFLSRDHTERMLRGMGAKISEIELDGEEGWIEIEPLEAPLEPLNLRVPADPSSAFFFAVAAAITPGAKVLIESCTLNQTRIEAYKVLAQMGAEVKYIEKENRYEPVGDIEVSYAGKLRGVEVSGKIAWLIDELPALSVAMACAEGRSVVKNAAELRVKESDRIATVLEALSRCGIETEEFPDGYAVVGGEIRRAVIESGGDHRIAMSFAIAGLIDGMEIVDTECIDTSFPNFFEILSRITELRI
jgi:3-phosphoshikimate 1-carboxyvinyltransferase